MKQDKKVRFLRSRESNWKKSSINFSSSKGFIQSWKRSHSKFRTWL